MVIDYINNELDYINDELDYIDSELNYINSESNYIDSESDDIDSEPKSQSSPSKKSTNKCSWVALSKLLDLKRSDGLIKEKHVYQHLRLKWKKL
ncbi:hypothetical protein Glove_460g48 [Diversispora epigaea]|uniref:Uncharacterized protein n=1 Tax=Diversispora epigaea TaxID=1348612 RepID=A0A397GQJ5_9GLOM|nr:hypothetical protein Glove_460g48 [Diversispora epigaea]